MRGRTLLLLLVTTACAEVQQLVELFEHQRSEHGRGKEGWVLVKYATARGDDVDGVRREDAPAANGVAKLYLFRRRVLDARRAETTRGRRVLFRANRPRDRDAASTTPSRRAGAGRATGSRTGAGACRAGSTPRTARGGRRTRPRASTCCGGGGGCA